MTTVPKVTVPMNFGIEYLNSPSHDNLRFLLEGDEELLANSGIMSFNSPVIKKMTIEDGRTTVDVQDFSKESVQCFLESSYSGSLTNISKAIFKDVNKIAHFFKVTWLIDRCFEYFKSLTEVVGKDNFDDQLFLFDEAMYILEKLEKRNYIDEVVSKFNSLTACTEFFVTNYLNDISVCSTEKLDEIIMMTNDQEHILIKVLVNNLETGNPSLNQNSRHILEKLNFTTFSSGHALLYDSLLQKLENIDNPSTEDYRLIIRILRQSSEKNQSRLLLSQMCFMISNS